METEIRIEEDNQKGGAWVSIFLPDEHAVSAALALYDIVVNDPEEWEEFFDD